MNVRIKMNCKLLNLIKTQPVYSELLEIKTNKYTWHDSFISERLEKLIKTAGISK